MKRLITCVLFLFTASQGLVAQDVDTPIEDLEASVPQQETDALWAEATRYREIAEEAGAAEDALEEQLGAAAEEQKPELEASLAEAEGRIDDLLARLQLVVDELESRGEDVTELEVFLTKASGEISLENVSVDVAASLVDDWLSSTRDWVADRGPGLIFQAFVFVAVFFAFWVLSRILVRITTKALGSTRLKLSDLFRSFLVKIVRNGTLILGLLVAFSAVGVQLGPVLAGLGIAGFIIGFALQDTLAHFASGLMILLYRPYDVGDRVVAGGVEGFVTAMTMVSTTIKTVDNQLLIVPNGKIWGDVIQNVTAMPERRVDLVVGVSYSDDLDAAERVILETVRSHPKVLQDPEPVVKVSNLGDSSVDLVVRPWCATPDYWDVWFDLTKTIKQRLDSEGISIPFPQRDVHLFPTGGAAEAS